MARFLALLVLLAVAFAPSTGRAQDLTQGMLRITSAVPGAVVHIDYAEVGLTPLTRYVSAGTYVVRVAADGFDPFVRRVQVAPQTTTEVRVDLVPGGGTVEFNTVPDGAVVRLDGVDAGRSPIRLSKLTPGRHTWELVAPGFETLAGEFTFAAQGNVLVHRELRSSAGRFIVESTPAGAEVFLDGARVGVTPVELDGVALGSHRVVVRLDGYGTVFRAVDTGDGSMGRVQAGLDAEAPWVQVRTANGDAAVRLEGFELGVGSTVKAQVARGTYELEVVAPGLAPAVGFVPVPSAGKVVLAADLGEDVSVLEPVVPLLSRWTFWTGLAVGAIGAGAGAVLVAQVVAPEPVPPGDTVLTLP